MIINDNINKFLVLIIVLNTIALCNSSSIHGHITDIESNEPLMGANIMLEGTMLGAASDEGGDFFIYNVPIGSYTLIAMYIGYKTLKQTIQIEGKKEYTIDIKLQSSAIKLQETKVTAEKRKGKVTGAPASMEIVSSRDIKREATTNIGSYLKGLKGVDFTSSGINNYSISIRGFNSSFNTRVLTLTDGRVANIPALRVINYSTVPQSMDDIDRMEVILGPATALYGANAHSGVVNIISKPPAQSEGLTMSVSGSNDERELRKINGRWATKLTDKFSIKLSGMYLHGYEWPYISETEYKKHLYPWTGHPYRMYDDKDNNGNGEVMDTGDPDGDGVMGEDWFNGYDDDGDGLIDEDYFTADGKDNGGIPCTSDSNEDGCYCCIGDDGVDENIDSGSDVWNDGYDNDGNGQIDDAHEMFTNNPQSANNPNWSYNLEQNNIIIAGGRGVPTIHGQPNPWYNPDATIDGSNNLMGNFYYDEEQVKYVFDVYIYDWGADGIPGDPYEDLSGNGTFEPGESFSLITGILFDYGMDGEPNTGDPGEDDGIYDPGDSIINDDGNGILDEGEEYDDVWPPPNGQWDEGEIIKGDWGNDGEPYTDDPGEDDGLFIPWDFGENDGIFEKGDDYYGFGGEIWIDCSWDLTRCEDDEDWEEDLGNGRWDPGETFDDVNGDGLYTPPDYMDNFQFVDDVNGDGLSDYPDFEVENRKIEFRLDFDPSRNINMTFQSGYAWTKTQQVTGTGRFLADGFEYKYYQLRGRFNNWYSQIYMNQSFAGNTRSYNEGNIIEDRSKNYAFQLQRNYDLEKFNTKLVWGVDYFKTLPSTNGSILNDGPNGYDNDGDNLVLSIDGIDNDGDGEIDETKCADGMVDGIMDGIPDSPGRKDGKPWECGEGIDEPDEFINPESNEYGFYYQTKTELFGTSRFELITAARLDYHDLLDEGVQFAPKIGFIYKPNEKSSFRFTYGKAFNTPNSIALYTDLHVRKLGILDIYLRGNKDGTPYCRVGEPCSDIEKASAHLPGFYTDDTNTEFHYITPLPEDYFSSNSQHASYADRVQGAPYFFNYSDTPPKDMIPLDTFRYVIFIPELNGDGVLYTPEESMNILDVDPIKTEKIQTLEFGYKGLLGSRTHLTVDYYLSYYEDFFSPPTFITPSVFLRDWGADGQEIRDIEKLQFAGFMTVNDFGGRPPYATAWNGKDDDGDWDIWADEFGWREDLNGDCPNGAAANDPCRADPGDWGFVEYDVTGGGDPSDYINIYHPYEVAIPSDGGIDLDPDIDFSFFDAVGVDEYIPSVGLNESERVVYYTGEGGEQTFGPGLANAPAHLVLSPMNYGDVWMQGLDMGLTQLIPEYNLTLDGNISWYGTTEYYNKLTKKNDPINAPEWKWNTSIKWDLSPIRFALNYRHVDEFRWNDGIWEGIIGPYDIIDLHCNYMLTENLELSISASNLIDDRHKELIGGAQMGRSVIMRMTSNF